MAGEHVHPVAREAFTVVRGELAVRRGGRDLTAGPGVRTEVPPGVAHEFWNPTDEEVRVVVEAERVPAWPRRSAMSSWPPGTA